MDLTPKALDLLAVLVERAGQLVTRDELLAALWPDAVVEENALSVQVSRLRAALGETARDWRYVETVPRSGYRFAGAVAVEAAPTAPVPAMPASTVVVHEREAGLVTEGMLTGSVTRWVGGVAVVAVVVAAVAVVVRGPSEARPATAELA
ncbi:MAG: winged helix-turn-helix domain-containing protein, partial [Rhodothermales bacterium]|nr:winged helix-turn-helix domain-containing protein [Rhodothermales bacterium]